MREIEPTIITQGDRIEWTRAFNDFPADQYTLEYRFRGPGKGLNVTATSGTSFDAVVTAAQSTAMLVGRWMWQAWATKISDATKTEKIASGLVRVDLGFASTDNAKVDLRTPNKITLDTITAAISGIANEKVMEYEVSTPAGMKRIKRIFPSDLLKLRDTYAKLVVTENARERVRNGGSWGSTIQVRTTNR